MPSPRFSSFVVLVVEVEDIESLDEPARVSSGCDGGGGSVALVAKTADPPPLGAEEAQPWRPSPESGERRTAEAAGGILAADQRALPNEAKKEGGRGRHRPDVPFSLHTVEPGAPPDHVVRQLARLRMDHHYHHYCQLRRHGARRQTPFWRQNHFVDQNGKCCKFNFR